MSAHVRAVPARERTDLARAIELAVGERGLLIETCHRVDFFTFDEAAKERLLALDVPGGARLLHGADAVHHAIAVAVGRDSVVVGEDQIVHQVRAALDAARRNQTVDPLLERLFATALHAGRRARSWRRGPVRSLATAALDEIERSGRPIRGQTVLIVGAGRMGRLAAREGAARGASILVSSRTPTSAESLAADVDGRTVPFGTWPATAGPAGVVVALGGPWPIGREAQQALAGTPVVDLSVPAAIPNEMAADLGSRLITADDLARLDAGTNGVEGPEAARLEGLIDQAANAFLEWLDDRDRRTAAAALALRVDQVRAVELDALWRRLPDSDPDTRAAIDSMARHLAERLLREPLEHLRNDRDGSGERAVREVFAL